MYCIIVFCSEMITDGLVATLVMTLTLALSV